MRYDRVRKIAVSLPRHTVESAAQDEAMTGLTLDAGALIAFERNDPQVVALIVLADLIVV